MNEVLLAILLSLLALSCPAQTSTDKSEGFHIEGVMEYVPVAALFGLKACGVDSRHKLTEQLVTTAAAYAVMAGTVEVLKHTVHSERPDKSDTHGFPSGHTAVAFTGADMLFEEYRDTSPWIGIGGYAVATATGILRVHHKRHHWGDVVAGAAIGVGCSRLSQWLTPKLFKTKEKEEGKSLSATPFASGDGMGLAVCFNF